MRTGRGVLLVLALVVSVLSGCTGAPADSRLNGQWHGTIAVPGAPLMITLEFTGDDRGIIDIPAQEIRRQELTDVVAEPGAVRFTVPELDAGFTGRLNEAADTVIGDFTRSGRTYPLSLTRQPVAAPARPQEPEPPYPYPSEDVTYRSGDITVAGTLTRPAGPGPYPAVVLAGGSGPQDRNEQIAGHKPFLVLADTLTRAGYAVLRTDDRGVGGTGGNLDQTDYPALADDLAAGLAYLRDRPDIDRDRVGLLGHSEGGYLAPLVAARPENRVAFVILLAAPAVPGTEILDRQARDVFTQQGATPEQIDTHLAFLADWTAALRAGQLTKGARLSETYNRTLPEELRVSSAAINNQNTPYMAALVSYDPASALGALRMPVLACYGSKDVQVPADQNVAPMGELLAADPDATVRVLAGLNHLMQPADTGRPAEYRSIETTLAPELLDTVTGWLDQRFGAR